MYALYTGSSRKEVLIKMEISMFLDPLVSHDRTICTVVMPHDEPLCLEKLGPGPSRYQRAGSVCSTWANTSSLWRTCVSYLMDDTPWTCVKLATSLALIPQKFKPTSDEFDNFVDFCVLYRSLLAETVTPARDAVYALFVPNVSPLSEESIQWYTKCVDVVNHAEGTDVEAYVNHISGRMHDRVSALFDRLPFVLAATAGICCILIFVITQSVALSILSFALIAWTVYVTFAVANLVYTSDVIGALLGRFAWTNVLGVGGVCWLVPPLTFPLILGVGLDYIIFLMGRVLECRRNGCSDREAFVKGVSLSGPVIVSAGLIMSVAFGGLIFAQQPAMNQVALMLIIAVLLDTFFVCCLATPAIHSLLGTWNWWPRKFP